MRSKDLDRKRLNQTKPISLQAKKEKKIGGA